MKLCYITNPNAIHARRWLEHFAKRGHEVYLLTIVNEFAPIEGVKIYYIPPVPLKLSKKFGRGEGWLSLIFSSWSIRRLVKLIKPDVVHAHSAAFFGWLAALTGFHPLIITLWGNDILADQGALRFPKNILTPLALKQADMVTGMSDYLLNAAKIYLKPNTKTRVIRNTADLKIFNPHLDAGFLKNKLELGNSPVILSPRPFEPVYNTDTIVAAIPLVLEQLPQARFVLINDTSRKKYSDYTAQILTKIAERGLEQVIRYVTDIPHPEMVYYYRMSDVVISITSSDGFPVSVSEAMACGIPVVLSDIPHLKEIFSDGRNALTVPPQNPHQLASAIIHLLKDDALRQKMIATNLGLINTRGNFDIEMQKMENLYRSLI